MRGFIAFPKSVPERAKFRNTPQLAAGIGILRIMEVYYSYLTATRMEGMENIGKIDIFTPKYCTL